MRLYFDGSPPSHISANVKCPLLLKTYLKRKSYDEYNDFLSEAINLKSNFENICTSKLKKHS